MAVIDKNYMSMGLPMVIDRGSPWALDTTSVWYSRELLEIYARGNAEELKTHNLPATAYVGQEVSLVDEVNKTVSVFVISDTEGTLKPVGGDAQVLCDETTIVLNNGELSLKDYGHRYWKYVSAEGTKGEEGYIEAHYELQEVDENHPWKAGLEARVADDGSLGWFEQNLSSAEGMAEELTVVQAAIEGLADHIGNVEADIDDLAEKTYRKDETYSKEKIDELVAGLFHFEGAVESFDELEAIEAKKGDVYQVGVDEYAWNGSEWVHLGNKFDLTGYVREEDLADYAKSADVEVVSAAVGSLTTDFQGFETVIGTLRETVADHETVINNNANLLEGFISSVGSLESALNQQSQDLVAVRDEFNILNTQVQNSLNEFSAVVGAPAEGDQEASGLFREIKLVKDEITELQLNSGSGELNIIERVYAGSIELLPQDKVIHIPEMSAGVAGLVPVATTEIIENGTNYFLNALGNWATPIDARIGSLVYNDQQYNTVEEYMDARFAWSEIE